MIINDMIIDELLGVLDRAERAADALQSRMSPDALCAPGTGSDKVSLFINWVCFQIPDCRYLEYGTFCGRSLVAAAHRNRGTFIGVDNQMWLGPNEVLPRQHGPYCPPRFASADFLRTSLRQTLLLHAPDAKVEFTSWKAYRAPHHFDVCFYDAGHSREDTREGVRALAATLKPGIMIADDFIAPNVRLGAEEGIAGFDVAAHRIIPAEHGWHRGLGVWLVR